MEQSYKQANLRTEASRFCLPLIRTMTIRIRTILPAMVLLLLAGACGYEQTATTSQPQQPRKQLYNPPYSNEPVEPFRIIDNIYYVGRENYSAFLITTPEGHFLLDTMVEETVPNLSENIQQLGFQLEDVKIILQAHAHRDHVGGMAKLKELTGAQVLVMAQDEAVLADGGTSDFRGDGSVLWEPVQADKTLQDGEEVQLGGVTMVAHLTAGHTKGCTAWTTVAEENGREYNAVFVCSNRVSGGVPLIGNSKYPTIAEDYASGFQTLKTLPGDVFLASHGFMFNLEEKLERLRQGTLANPFLDPQGFQEYIADYEQAFLDALEDERAAAP